MRWTRCARMAALATAAIALSSDSVAQSHPEYIRLGQLSAALYKPDSGPAPHVAFLIAHRTANYLNHIGCRELSARGFLHRLGPARSLSRCCRTSSSDR